MKLSRRELLQSAAALAGGALPPMAAAGAAPARTPLASIAAAAVASGATPAVQACVIQAGKVLEAISVGQANLETASAATAGSIFRIGSLTKQVTGALLAMLDREGACSLDAPASTYLPFLQRHAPFTLRELAHHTAGVHEDQEAGPLAGEVSQRRLAEAIAGQGTFFDFPPGTAWAYSNSNYVLLGAVIEAVTGLSLQEVTRRRITSRVPLRRTAYDDPAEVLVGRAAGYALRDGDGPRFANAAWMDVVQAGAAGAMRSTAADLAQLHQAMLFGDLLSDAERAAVLAPARLRDGTPASARRFREEDRAMGALEYGLGVHLDATSAAQGLLVHHHGFISGFSSYLATHLPSRRTVACLCNVEPHPRLPFREVRRAVFRDLLRPVQG